MTPRDEDIGPSVEIRAALSGLGAHVGRCAHRTSRGQLGALAEWDLVEGLGQSKIDDFGAVLTVDFCDQDVGRFQVAMQDSLLVGMLNAPAGLHEELEASLDG